MVCVRVCVCECHSLDMLTCYNIIHHTCNKSHLTGSGCSYRYTIDDWYTGN